MEGSKSAQIYQKVILFDGVCNLCNSSVNFIIDRDPQAKFKFTSLQSEEGQEILNEFNLPTKDFDTIIYVENGKLYNKSSAALKIAKGLNGAWPLLYIFYFLPKFFRDFFYNIIAKNRYKWFGKEDACRIPTPELKSRFI
ncbi:thiol-disulfide oxidoreductase DCC family protein [Flexithrix dorotheae]|uniref:thiol-disulfide oxidoreductase DCC family protein n=1 Tax=Flexithrix dorotheae TaxID=70993 RepID=UPI000370E60D|nr:DCC1-like thiol-disulfide oxidoreductase family protein [Flexithrix dorotheae]